ncbi:MAG: DNA-directed RNA polymerase subunit H [Candidatus Woesearchaeota archaeon]
MEHILVPIHEKLTQKQAEELLAKHNITFAQLPKIFVHDPALAELKPKLGDIIKITRKSPSAGQSFYYRGVVDE